MARLKYDSNLVNSAIDELGAASDQLLTTEDEMRSALTIIANARGINHVHSDTIINTLGYPTAVQEMIEETITSIKTRAQEVEEYNEKYENASFLEKLGSTAGLFLTKVVEGFASAGEQIVDGFASVIGWGAGLVSKDAQDSIANFIKKDHVGDFFGNLYDTSFKDMVIKSWASEKGLACNIFKGVGTGIGYAAALYTTGYIAGGLSTGTVLGAKAGAASLLSSLPAAATTAGVAGIGAGTQAGLKGGLDYNKAFANGIKYGAIQAGTTIVFTYAFKALSKGIANLKAKWHGTKSTALTTTPQGGTGGPTGNPTGTGPTGTGPTGGAGGGAAGASSTASTVKSGVTFEPYKGYTCLDDVWDDAIAGNIGKKDVIDIVKNTIGLDDGGLGHTFMSDYLNFVGGDASMAAGASWRAAAANLGKDITDETASAISNTIHNTGPTTTTTTTTGATTTTSGSSSTSLTTIADDTFNGAGGKVTQEVVEEGTSRTAGQLLGDMENISRGLSTKQNALNLAQQQLDDAIAQGADDATISALQKNVTSAQNAVDLQLDKLRLKQQAYITETASGKYNAVGTEKMKLINGEFVDDITSTAGDVTTLRVQTTRADGTVELRPNWTNASAMKEGQINPKEFAKLLDDAYGPVPPTTTTTTALVPKGPTDLVPVNPGTTALVPKGPTGLVPVNPGTTALVPKGPTGLVPVTPPQPPAVVPPQVLYGPPPVTPPVTVPANSGSTIIFGVVQPEEITPPAVVDITPAQVDPVVIPEQVLYGPPPVIEDPPITIPDPPVDPPVTIPQDPYIPPQQPIVDTPVVQTPIIDTPVVETPIIETPPIDTEYVPIPNTGLGQPHNSKLGIAPVIAAAAGGLAGAFGGSLLSDKKKKDEDDDDIEELDIESEE